MTRRIGCANVSGFDVYCQERRSGYNVVSRCKVFVNLLPWRRRAETGSSVGSKAKASCLFRLLCLAKEHRSEVVFAACCLLVMAISVHDAMLVVLNADIIEEVERNPVGRWLIELQGGEVWLFVVVKLAGTAIASAILVTLYELRARLALVAGGGVASFQMILLWYLTFARI